YDALNRLSSVTAPLTRTTVYTHDLAGNLTALTDAQNRQTSYAYDPANELTGITYALTSTPNVTFTYTADGQRATRSDGTGTTSYTYDALKRLTRTVDGAGHAVGYGYDLAGNLTTLTYPDGAQVTRTYDAADRLATVGDWLNHTTRFAYDADGNVI